MPHFVAILSLVVAQSGAADGRVAPGDVFRLSSARAVALCVDLVVNGDGTVWLPKGRMVRVAGSSWTDAKRAIRTALRVCDFDTLGLEIDRGERSSKLITVTGAVHEAGSVGFRKGMRLADVVAWADPTVSADLDHIQITDVSGRTTVARFVSLTSTDADWNLPIRGGDHLFFPLAQTATDVGVLGEVMHPGRFDFFAGMTLRQALGLAGGATGNGVTTSIELVRDGVVIDHINVDLGYDAELRRGDVVRVVAIENPQYVFVVGYVVHEGRFAYKKGMRLTEALGLADGLQPLGLATDINVIRRVGGVQKRLRFDLNKIKSRKIPNPILEPGDTIEVKPLVPKKRGGR